MKRLVVRLITLIAPWYLGRVVVLYPADILVFNFDRPISETYKDTLKDACVKTFGITQRILILEGGVHLSAVHHPAQGDFLERAEEVDYRYQLNKEKK